MWYFGFSYYDEPLTKEISNLWQIILLTETIKLYLMNVYSIEIDIGVAKTDLNIFHHFLLHPMIASIKKVEVERRVREKQPITWLISIRMFNAFDNGIFRWVTFEQASTFSLSSFLFSSESNLSHSQIKEQYFQQSNVNRKSSLLDTDQLKLLLPY